MPAKKAKKKGRASSQDIPAKNGTWTAELDGDTLTLTVKLVKGYKTEKGNTVRATTGGNRELDEIAPGLFIGCTLFQK